MVCVRGAVGSVAAGGGCCGDVCACGFTLWFGGCVGRGFMGSVGLVWIWGRGRLRVCVSDILVACAV